MVKIYRLLLLLNMLLFIAPHTSLAEKYKVLDYGNFSQFWGLGAGGNLGGDLNAPDATLFPPGYYESDTLRHLNIWLSGMADYYFDEYLGVTAAFHYGRSLEQSASEASNHVVSNLNSPLRLEAGLYWYLMNDMAIEKKKFALDSSFFDIGNTRHTTTISLTAVPHQVRTIVAARGGIYYDRGNSVFNSYKVDVNYNFFGAYVGVAYIENVASSIDILEGEYQGVHSHISSTQYYADIIIGSGSAELVYDTSSGATAAIIAGSQLAKPELSSGWRVGRKVEWEAGTGTDIQIGRLPGYFDNFYISTDIYFGFDLNLNIPLDKISSHIGIDL